MALVEAVGRAHMEIGQHRELYTPISSILERDLMARLFRRERHLGD